MKAILSLCAAILLALAGFLAWRFLRTTAHYGKPFTGAPAATIPELLEKPEAFLNRAVSVQGVLTRQCPASGCWFMLADPADPQARELKVAMGDTVDGLPPRLGRLARVEGQLILYGKTHELVGEAVEFTGKGAP